MNIVIIGNSAAGLAAAKVIRDIDTGAAITIITDEPDPAYARCLIPEVLAGEKDLEGIRYRPDSFFREKNISLLTATRVSGIDPVSRRILLDSGRELSYDRLLVATGASPIEPAGEGAELDGIYTFHNYRQAVSVGEAAGRANQAVVIGGGLAGIKAAQALRRRGVKKVTLVEQGSHLLPRQLDEESAAMVQKELSEMSIQFIFGESPARFIDSRGNGAVNAVQLAGGPEIPAEVVLVVTGVKPNTGLVEQAGGEVGKGIKVNEFLETTLPGIYAAGDCIEVIDLITGEATPSALWPLAVEQGHFAAYNMLGIKRPYPRPLTRLNSAQFGHVPFVSAGAARGEKDTVVVQSRSGKAYRKLVFDRDRLVGFILAGSVERAGVYTALVKKSVPVTGTLKNKLLEGTVSAADIMMLR